MLLGNPGKAGHVQSSWRLMTGLGGADKALQRVSESKKSASGEYTISAEWGRRQGCMWGLGFEE